MCKGCVASALTIDILRNQLDREKERADRYENLLFSLAGVKNESVPADSPEMKPIRGRATWSEIQRKLEAADRKKLEEMQSMESV